MKIVSIDNGYFATKFLSERKLDLIKSRYMEDPEGQFEFKGRKFNMGYGAYNIDHNKSENELHQLMTYFVLSKLTDYQEDFKLVLSLPMLHFKNQKASFKEYIEGDKIIRTRLNQESKIFNIKDCIVFLQGAGALYANNPIEYKGRLIGLLDIGGLTAQGAIFEDLKPIPESIFTIDAGGIILNNKIKTSLNEKYGLNIQDYEVPYLDGYRRDTQRITEGHFSQIILEMKKKNWSIETLPILCTGGASVSMMADKQLPKGMMANDPVFDHVKGLSKVGEMMFR